MISRGEQYAITDWSDANKVQWTGTLNRNRSLYMVGEVKKNARGEPFYDERLYDRAKRNLLVMQMEAQCVWNTVMPLPQPTASGAPAADPVASAPASQWIKREDVTKLVQEAVNEAVKEALNKAKETAPQLPAAKEEAAPNTSQQSQGTAPNAKGVREAAKPEPPKDIDPAQPAPGQEVSTEYFKWLRRKVGFECQQAIKRSVTYNMRSAGIFYGKNEMDSINFILDFDRSSSVVRPDNTITIAGDKAELQNSMGNWVRASYMCKINLGTQTVTEGFANEGRWPD